MSKAEKADGASGREKLDQAYECLIAEIPDFLGRGIMWLRKPEHRWIRIPAGLFLIALSSLWFLPVIGLEFIPIGLLVIAEDVPFLRRPMAAVILWGVNRWIVLRRWWQGSRPEDDKKRLKDERPGP